MVENQSADRVVTILKNCSSQLRKAHTDLSDSNAPIGSLVKISGVADALDALAPQIATLIEDAQKARRTAGGLTEQVRILRGMTGN